MGNMFGMFSFAFWVIRALKCEAANFVKFELAGIPVRLIEHLDVPVLIIAHAPCTYDVHAHCDITRFAYCMARMPIVTSQGSHMMRTMSP